MIAFGAVLTFGGMSGGPVNAGVIVPVTEAPTTTTTIAPTTTTVAATTTTLAATTTTAAVTTTSAVGAGAGLPATGSSTHSVTLLLGLSLMAMGVVLLLVGRKSRAIATQ
jgi:LPXTG-motif cell wall-anchored protein